LVWDGGRIKLASVSDFNKFRHLFGKAIFVPNSVSEKSKEPTTDGWVLVQFDVAAALRRHLAM
jgi:hypothetical protein